jgi:integrase
MATAFQFVDVTTRLQAECEERSLAHEGQRIDERGGNLARRRYQRGQLLLKRRGEEQFWIGRWREDVIECGCIRRVRKTEMLGTLAQFRTKKLARRELDRRLAKVNDPGYRPSVALTFGEFLERWMQKELLNFKPSTAATFRSQIRLHLIPLLGDAQMSEINAERIQGAIQQVVRTRSPKTVRNLRATLQIVWRAAQGWGYATHNAVEGVRVPRRSRSERFYFSLEETRRILGAVEEPYRTIYWLAAETGMRAGEMAGLRWSDVDLDALTIRVVQSAWQGKLQTPKTANALRTFALSPQLRNHLRTFRCTWRPNTSDLLFATRNGKPADMNLVVKRKLHPLLAKLGIQVPARTGLHAFRHTNSSLMDRLSAPLKLRQQRLGHSDPRLTLSVYTHVASEDDVRVAEKLGELLIPAEILDSVGPLPGKEKGLSEEQLKQAQWIQ